MNAATVASAVNRTMLIAPMIAVIPNTRPAVIRSVLPAAWVSGVEVSVENVSLIRPHTSIAPSVRYRMPIAIIQTKNMTIATIRLIFRTVHGSTRLSCSDASRGGRRVVLPGRAPTCCGDAIDPSGAVGPGPPEVPAGTPVGITAPGPDGELTTIPRPDRQER